MIQRFEPNGRLNKMVIANGMVYLSGLTAQDTTVGVEEQTKSVLAQIDGYLERAGTSKQKVVSANIWLTSMSHAPGMNKVWESWVEPAHAPARATVESKLASPDILVEIMVTATL
jgi:enamine deaminase RidA (YjgF/YER057c/UK114 family)